MARPLAADHDEKRGAILRAGARLFAESGYDRATMAEIAAACGVSKPLLYHYFRNKEQVLVAVLREHLDALSGVVAAADDERLPARARLRALVGALLSAYRCADDAHRVQINELSKLPSVEAASLVETERRLVARFSAVLALAAPELAARPALLKPVTMSLFGMLNWHYMWFREDGPLSREDYADLATDLILGGAMAACGRAATPAPRIPRRIVAEARIRPLA